MDILKINTCPLFGGKHLGHAITCTDHYASGEQFNLVRCDDCGFIFTQGAPVEAEIGRYYETPDDNSFFNLYIDTGIGKKT